MAAYNPKGFMVYVIKLDPAVLTHRKFWDDNPNYQSGKDCYCVGMTSRTPEERFKQHKAGYKACHFVSVVTKFAGLLVKLRDGHQMADYAQ